MANTLVKIQTVTVGSGGAATISFTSIPQTYTDIKIVVSARTNHSDTQDVLFVKPNGSTSNLTYISVKGDGSATTANANNRLVTNGNTATANVFGSADIYIPNYASAQFKSILADGVQETDGTDGNRTLVGNLWSDTAAITSVVLAPVTGTLFLEYSSATLYGIKNT